MNSAPSIRQASLHILVAFDVGFEIRLAQIPALFKERPRDASGYNFMYSPLGREWRPLRIGFEPTQITLQGKTQLAAVFATFFDVGALSLEFILPLDSPWEDLPRLAAEIQSSKELTDVACALASSIAQRAQPAVTKLDFFPVPSVFTVFNIRNLEERLNVQGIFEKLGSNVAKTLRLSSEPIGTNEVNRTLNPHVTYSDDDVVFTSSSVAMVFDETSSEVIDTFELANVQSLELRFIDGRLDRTLQGLYEESEHRSGWGRKFPNLLERQARKLNTIHLDSTIIAERVEQSFKFAQDSHLVRIHELCVRNMFLELLGRGIDRKLQAIRDIFNDQLNRASSLRMEILEWIIIGLIAIEVVPVLFNSLKNL